MKSINEIVAIKQAAEKKILSMKGVTGIDVGYKYVGGKRTDEIAIRVHVAKKVKGLSKAESIPGNIDGIQTDVLQNVFEPQYMKVKPEDMISAQADTGAYSPLKGGVSIGPDRVIGGYVFVGTLGAPVVDIATNKTMLLSNFHVMCVDTGWHVGDVMDQPGRVDGGSIANRVATLSRGVLSSHVDGAVSLLDAGKSTVCEIVDIGTIRGTAAAVLNAPVRKRGRTTLLTYGFVDAINATISINYGGAIGTRTLTNQIGVRPDTAHNPKFSDHGDSGSVVVDANNKVVGLLFAGNTSCYTYMNTINFVLSELNIRMCVKSLKETIKDRKEIKIEKLEIKEHKLEKHEIKEVKIEKLELKEHKIEKLERKELILEGPKHIFEHDPKGIREGGINPGDFNPGELIPGTHNDAENQAAMEERIARLEAALGQLSAFISQDIRPDLSHGAYSNEEF